MTDIQKLCLPVREKLVQSGRFWSSGSTVMNEKLAKHVTLPTMELPI